MKGVGGYHDWPYYASPTSNLSAFAAPFSVNPYTSSEASSQFMDTAESAETLPPIQFQPYRSNLVEAQPYTASSAIHDHSSNSAAPYHWSSGAPSSDWPSLREANRSPELGFSGQSAVSWDQFPEFNSRGKGKQVGVGSNLSVKETNAAGSVGEQRRNQGNQDVKDSSNCEVPQIIDWENYNVPASANHIHNTSNWWGTIKPMPVEFSGTSVMQSPSMSLETHHETPLKVVADSGNNHSLNIGSYYKHSSHVDKPSRVDTVSSMPGTMLVTDLNVQDIIADEHVGHDDFYNTKEASHMPSPGTAGLFNPGPIHMHLRRNEPSSSNKAMISDKNVSRNVADYIFRESHEFQNPHANMDNLRLGLSAIEDVNFVEKSFEGGDRCNPAEDSPCWKGASAARFSHFEPSAALSQEYVHKKESSFGSVIKEPQNYLLDTENNMKKSCGNSNGFQMHTGIVYQDRSSAGSPRRFSVTKFAPEYCKSGSALNDGPFQSKPSCDFGLQQYVDITKMKENTVPPAKPTDCESGSSQMGLQLVDLKEFITQKQQALLCTGDVNSGCNVNNCSEYDSSHTAEHVLPLPSSVLDATTPENSAGKASTEKLDVQMLLDRMQNLSELLLSHCLNDACEWKEQDCNVLKNVISNLNTCALKNEQIAPVQECLFNQPETSKHAGESRKFRQNSCLKRPQLTKIGPESSKIEFENPLVAEANFCFRSGKPHRKLSDSISPRVDTEMTKADNMTKDLKRILSENFHGDDDEGAEPQTVLYKNLWLEAEATLCSVYYRARYNQMKIEMDKHSYKEKVMEKQSKSEVIPTLSQSQSSATKVHYPNPDSSADLKFPVLDVTNLEELSRLNISTDMNKSNAITPEGRGQNLDSFIDNYLVPCSVNKTERNDESSVMMARYQVLKARIDQSSTVTTNLEEPLDVADSSSPRGRDNQNQVNLCQDSPIPEKNSAEYETSVLARFHILKSRDEGSSSISSEGKQLHGDESAAVEGMDGITVATNVSEGKSLDVHANPVVVHLNSYTAVDKSIPKEFHLDSEDNQETQPSGTCEFQPPTYYSDGFASDWEHVEKSL
ncbi:hypothetical protein GLYMA_06G138000v4 [Glycine max]|nr:hypothetical protein GLYMA_06G138000v4 [Glycine max]